MSYELKEYIGHAGKSYFGGWFEKLSPSVAAKIRAALYKMEQGNFSNTKSVGNAVCEFKINTGPGYRIYFGMIDKSILLLLIGGTKRGQQKDIEQDVGLLREYKKSTWH